ncbi:MAG: Protein FecR [Stenotrophomonas maltophilia]|nr:MAG: Protein FecR [Stenotrophomonas maltophilia]
MSDSPVDALILGEAADWMVRLAGRTPDAQDLAELQCWRERSAAHAEAWRRAESLLGGLGQVPSGVGRQSLQRAEGLAMGRRQMLGRLGLVMLAVPLGWAAWKEQAYWRADLRTATGEQLHRRLPDGSELVLNTASAVAVDFSEQARSLRLLGGEVLLSTHLDPQPRARPFSLLTRLGPLLSHDARFAVRDDDERLRVAVFDGSLGLPTGQWLKAGQQATWLPDGNARISDHLDANAATWERGMLLAEDMRLHDLLGEMSRYRHGVLRCAQALDDLRVTGAIPLGGDDAGIRLLADILPVRVQRMTRYWVSLEPA